MGKSTTLEALVRFCDAVETLYTRDYLRRPTPRDLQRLLQKAEARGFPGMVGSIDCMHWQWKNCPTAWQGDYGNRKGQKSIILEAVAGFDTWVWHAFFGVPGSQNDLNVLGQSPVFNDVLRGQGPNITYEDEYDYEVEEVYESDPMNTALTRIYERPMGPSGEPFEPEPLVRDGRFMTRMIDRYQEMQSSYVHERRQRDLMAHLWADEYDYEAEEVYESDPMNTALTRIYERPMGPSGEPFEPEPLVRDGRFMTRMIDPYQEMQSSYVHERRQRDLMAHLWAVIGNQDE
ncbi:uncharacterized protein LOC110745247 [Prunus avium]|uniref:Uncharacterized protein LOC110745247 n=1 Tax=Prunus avium TaxID=42229 RepID=A0A6P5RDI2_PRUAV|nr:uncharacterized protein LOC110745247 [Prunus avium]